MAGFATEITVSRKLEFLHEAWTKREGEFARVGALRVFHGPTEGQRDSELSRLAVEVFKNESGDSFAWVFAWEVDGVLELSESTLNDLKGFYTSVGVKGAVLLKRPEKGAPEDAARIFGEVPEFLDTWEEKEKFRIRFEKTKHPGLFLDHLPLRTWLRASGQVVGKSVLNTFSYTGSLSVAARSGGASRVVTLDLSKPTISWAKENWELNFPGDASGDFIFGDVFEWLPKLAKRGDRFDAVILDPPSFSRSPKRVFSTARDLSDLHASALKLLNPGGLLITSINSAQITRAQFRAEIESAAKGERRKLEEVEALGAPSVSFPGADYLKGWIFRAQ